MFHGGTRAIKWTPVTQQLCPLPCYPGCPHLPFSTTPNPQPVPQWRFREGTVPASMMSPQTFFTFLAFIAMLSCCASESAGAFGFQDQLRCPRTASRPVIQRNVFCFWSGTSVRGLGLFEGASRHKGTTFLALGRTYYAKLTDSLVRSSLTTSIRLTEMT